MRRELAQAQRVSGDWFRNAFWDSAFQHSWSNGAVRKSFTLSRPMTLPATALAARAAFLVSNYPPPSHWNAGGFDPALWEAQSHRVGYRVGYKQLPCGENSAGATLTAGYVNAANAAACQQIVLAGYRLAALEKNLLATTPMALPRHRISHRH